MTLYDPYRPQYRQLCFYARTFADIADKSIFSKVNEFTTKAQFDLALQNLKALAERLESHVDLFHYPQAYGSPHSCVRDVFNDAEFRLKGLSIMHQKAEVPEPKQQLITREGAVIDLEERVETNREETEFGTDDTSFDNRNAG
jgi:hypothetical protein